MSIATAGDALPDAFVSHSHKVIPCCSHPDIFSRPTRRKY
jgi:hypothetical protein